MVTVAFKSAFPIYNPSKWLRKLNDGVIDSGKTVGVLPVVSNMSTGKKGGAFPKLVFNEIDMFIKGGTEIHIALFTEVLKIPKTLVGAVKDILERQLGVDVPDDGVVRMWDPKTGRDWALVHFDASMGSPFFRIPVQSSLTNGISGPIFMDIGLLNSRDALANALHARMPEHPYFRRGIASDMVNRLPELVNEKFIREQLGIVDY